MPIIQALRMLRQDCCEFKDGLEYIAKSYFKNKHRKKPPFVAISTTGIRQTDSNRQWRGSRKVRILTHFWSITTRLINSTHNSRDAEGHANTWTSKSISNRSGSTLTFTSPWVNKV